MGGRRFRAPRFRGHSSGFGAQKLRSCLADVLANFIAHFAADVLKILSPSKHPRQKIREPKH